MIEIVKKMVIKNFGHKTSVTVDASVHLISCFYSMELKKKRKLEVFGSYRVWGNQEEGMIENDTVKVERG